MLFVPFITILFYSAALKWISELHGKHCTCAEEWRLKYMKAFFITGLIGSVIVIVAIFKKSLWVPIIKYWNPFMTLVTVLYAGIALSYFVDLQKKDCKCALGTQEKFMYIMSIIQVIAIGSSVALNAYITGHRLTV